uniref:HNH endonuclease family protein n=1 Tax=Nostoc piscinale TaxID=224012 RepID=UPI0039A73070
TQVLYSKYAQGLSNTDNPDKIQSIISDLVRKLKEKLPSFEEFEVNFMDLFYTRNKQRDKKVIQYVLEKLMGETINGLPIDYNSASIEHLLSESKGDEAIVGKIGNLILVDKKTNGEELKDFEFIKKIKILRDKNYPIDEHLLNATQWTDNEIEARGKSMAYKAYYEIWSL